MSVATSVTLAAVFWFVATVTGWATGGWFAVTAVQVRLAESLMPLTIAVIVSTPAIAPA